VIIWSWGLHHKTLTEFSWSSSLIKTNQALITFVNFGIIEPNLSVDPIDFGVIYVYLGKTNLIAGSIPIFLAIYSFCTYDPTYTLHYLI
jgi:hypothetical protein